MNYYERIQKSIDYIEGNLDGAIDLNQAAREAFMSASSFYRMFFALTGHSVKEYIRLRRISLAARDLRDSCICVIDLAVKCGFESGDAFSRAFRRITGFLPSEFRKKGQQYHFKEMSIMDKYFEIQDRNLLEKYPDIKVLKELPPTRVAYYRYYGKDPEANAFEGIKNWIDKTGLLGNNRKRDLHHAAGRSFRVFGYNDPSPTSPDQAEYGYEVCVTIEEDLAVNDDKVGVKMLEGGLYAVAGVKRNEAGDLGGEIMRAWQRFHSWLTDSKYVYGGHQWMEEHLGFDEAFRHIGGIDLYMPIAERDHYDMSKQIITVEPIWTAAVESTGRNAADRARRRMLEWSSENGLFQDGRQHRFFAYYNHERIGYDDFFFKMHVTVDEDFETKDPEIKKEKFSGGLYAVMKAKYKYNGMAWGEFIKWTSKSKEYSFGDHRFFEEYLLDKPEICMETDMLLHMPIQPKK